MLTYYISILQVWAQQQPQLQGPQEASLQLVFFA